MNQVTKDIYPAFVCGEIKVYIAYAISGRMTLICPNAFISLMSDGLSLMYICRDSLIDSPEFNRTALQYPMFNY